MSELTQKIDALKAYIAEKGSGGVVVAFSGGVDSATLAALSKLVLGERVVAVTAKSETFTGAELEEAKRVAQEIGVKLYITQTRELENEAFASNPPERCYFCKQELLKKIVQFAVMHGFGAVFDGTNHSDLAGHRPGFRAVQEAEHVYSPLVELKFSKEEVRAAAKTLGLTVHDRPSQACLASRIPYHERITAERLRRVAEAEATVRKVVPVTQLRVRDHNGLARIEVAPGEIKLFTVDVVEVVAVQLKRLGFKYVTLDLEGYRSGSMLQAA